MKYDGVEDFVGQQLELLNIEREAEIAASRQLQENVSAKILQQNGVCLTNLSLHNLRSGLYGRSIASFGPKLHGNELPSTNLGSGDIVGIFLNSSSSHLEKDQICSGIVSCLKNKTLDVALDLDSDNVELNDNEAYKVIQLANNITYRRLKEGLNNLKNYNGPATALMNCVFGNRKFSPPASSYPPALVSHSGHLVWFNTSLDDSQKQAVEFALKQREVAVIHGPPGTGKTTTVAEVILQHVKAGNKILACAPSNVAVDNLLEKLIRHTSVKAVRLGHPTRMHESIQNRSLDAIIQASDSQSIVNDVRKELDAQLKLIAAAKKKRGPIFGEIKELRKELRQRETKAIREVLGHADVVLATLTTATADGPLKHLPPDHFDYVVIDECSQATEAACWLALTYAPRALLAGDHHQLPPTILSTEAERRGLSLTLMERILEREDGQSSVRMLQVQYRMHQEIMTWSSNQLYGGQLRADGSVAQHLLCHLANVDETEDTSVALLLIDTAGCDLFESAESDQGSKANGGEAALTALHVRRLIDAGVRPQDIAVVTPYNLQVDLLRQILNVDYPALEIRSVDGFQGREKEAVILSLVRSNTNGQVGFVSDVRRLNVAVTRARRHLCLITDTSTTGKASNGLIDHMEQHGEVRSAQEYTQEMDSVVIPDVGAPIAQVKSSSVKRHEPRNQPPLSSRESEAAVEADMRSKIDRWMVTEDGPLEFPATLTAFERKIVHQIAEKLGLSHQSVGEDAQRRIIIRKPAPAVPPSAPETPPASEVPEVRSVNKEEGDAISKPRDEEKKSHPPNPPKKVATKSKAADVPQVQSKEKPVAMQTSACPTCGKQIPMANSTLHQVQCQKMHSQPAVRPKQKIKPMPQLDESRSAKPRGDGAQEDVDQILGEFRQLDTVCNFLNCKTSVTCIGQQCQFCQRRFCLSHHMPEVHGCGEACRRQARGATLRQGFVSAGTLNPVAKNSKTRVDPAKRANLQRKLDRKIQDLSTKRAGPSKKEDKKK